MTFIPNLSKYYNLRLIIFILEVYSNILERPVYLHTPCTLLNLN